MRRGYSLLELTVVITILAVLTGFATRALEFASIREGLTAERLAADLRYAQARAMATHNRTWVSFDTANNRYTVYEEDPANTGKAGRLDMVDPLTAGSPFRVTLGDDEAGGVVLAGPAFGGKTEVEFDPAGLAYDGDATALTELGTVRLGSAVVKVSPAGWVGVN